MNPNHLNLIKQLGYLPVGLGENKFSNEWYTDNRGDNISKKNPYYGEYTFHYWLWKNNKIEFNNWIGFCKYRKFWKNHNAEIESNEIHSFKKNILIEIPKNLSNFDAILVDETFINQFRFSKFIKHN